MPHKCVACEIEYEDDSEVVMTGCPCGSTVFQYVRNKEIINADDEGVYDLNLKKIFHMEEQEEPALVIAKKGSYEIDLKRALREPLKRRDS